MGWAFAVACLAWAALFFWQRRRFQRHWKHLENILDDLAAERHPESFVFFKSRRFNRLAERLERLADDCQRTRSQRSHQSENLRIILATMDEGVLVTDSRRVVRMVNPAFTRLFEIRGEPLGQTILSLLREPVFDDLVSEALKTGVPQFSDLRTDHGKSRHFAVHAAPMRDAAGEPGVVAIARDITRLKQLEQMGREFVSNVSHELRTPLSIFQGYLENLIDAPDLPAEERASILEVMRKHSLRLNALVEDLLTLSRLEARDLQPKLAPVAVEKFLLETAADWSRAAARGKVEIRVEAAADLPPLSADEFQLAQVFNNLLENALKYTPTGGRIVLAAASDGDGLELRVEDTGAGISAADLPHIFERFFRSDKARSRERGGTGLGLSIVKHIVLAHDGTVQATSLVGEGTQIILRFPAHAEN